MDIVRIYEDFKIDYRKSGHKHCRTGWVQAPCPFCSGNPGYHLGFCIDRKSQFYNRFVCWRCGGKSTIKTIQSILKVREEEARRIISSYGGIPSETTHKKTVKISRIIDVNLPSGTVALSSIPGAIRYVEKRGFDPTDLQEIWGVMASGPGCFLSYEDKKIDLRFRLIIPIHYSGKIVSFQCRDWTGKSKLKYITCPMALESVFHKNILYGLDRANSKSVILMEGVTDVWRYGPGAVACFGIKYTETQVNLLARKFEEVFVMFDSEPQARIQALAIMRDLKERGVKGKVIRLPRGSDPGSMDKIDLQKYI